MTSERDATDEDDPDELLERHADLWGMTQKEHEQAARVFNFFLGAVVIIIFGVVIAIRYRG